MKESSQEVNSLFLKLFDLASSHGLLGRQPELAQRIEAASQRIRSTDGSLPDDMEIDTSVEIKKRNLLDAVEADLTPPLSEYNTNFVSIPQATVVEDIILLNDAQTPVSTSTMQVIARPTADNASFPFESEGYQDFQPGLSSLDTFANTLNMQPNPPLPVSGAHYETSFARRLQRRTAERALAFAQEPYPHPVKWSRVFGITSQFETKAQIIARLSKVVAATRDRTLSQWDQPFVHFGGSGTHYPRREQDTSTTPRIRAEYGMGPFSHRATKFQDKVVQDSLTLDGLQHYKDTYFDADDVQGYLENKLGIIISSSQDRAPIEVDLAKLFDAMNGDRSNNKLISASKMSVHEQAVPADEISPRSMSSSGSSPHNTSFRQDLTSGDQGQLNNVGDFNTRPKVTVDVTKFIEGE